MAGEQEGGSNLCQGDVKDVAQFQRRQKPEQNINILLF